VNPLIMLGPIGMMLVGLLSMLAWRWWSEVPLKYFLLGGIVWAAAMAPKALMDIAVTQALNSWARETFGVEGLLIVSSLYVSVRTGLLECGFTYLMFKRKLKQLSLDEAVAFGVGVEPSGPVRQSGMWISKGVYEGLYLACFQQPH